MMMMMIMMIRVRSEAAVGESAFVRKWRRGALIYVVARDAVSTLFIIGGRSCTPSLPQSCDWGGRRVDAHMILLWSYMCEPKRIEHTTAVVPDINTVRQPAVHVLILHIIW